MQSHSDNADKNIKEYLDKIRDLIELETNTYNKFRKGSLGERFKNYFDIAKAPAHNLEREYAPYKKILDNNKLSDAEKLKQLIAKANETRDSIEYDRQKGSLIGSKWNYGGNMHYVISEINPATPPEEDRNFRRANDDMQGIINEAARKAAKEQKAEAGRKSSAPGRIEGHNNNAPEPTNPSRRGSAPGRLSSNSSAMFGNSAASTESKADQCVKLLQDIFVLAFKLDIPEKEKNEYFSCNYQGILNNNNLSSEAKIDRLFKASMKMVGHKTHGKLHQIVLDVDEKNPKYIATLKGVRDMYKKAVESQQIARHDSPGSHKK